MTFSNPDIPGRHSSPSPPDYSLTGFFPRIHHKLITHPAKTCDSLINVLNESVQMARDLGSSGDYGSKCVGEQWVLVCRTTSFYSHMVMHVG